MGSRRRRFRSARVLLAVLLGVFMVIPEAAAASRGALITSDAGGAPSAGTRMPTVSGRSARAAHQTMSEAARGRPKANLEAPNGSSPGPGAAAPIPVASAAPRPAARAPSTSATIPTTTTLEATPTTVIYPAEVHLVATVTPAPVPSGGYIPAVSFYIDGAFSQPAELDANGVGTLDIGLAPGTYSLTAGFPGLADYGPSTSTPVSVVFVQAPPLAIETGTAALQASAGFPGDAGPRHVQTANPTLGVGPTEIVQMSENGARFFDRDGVALFHVGLADLFLFEPDPQHPSPHSPRTTYDTLHGRWISTEVTHDFFHGNGHVYVAISDTSDAIGGYWVYRFDLVNEAPRNPAIGISSNKLAIGFDVDYLDTGEFKGSTVMILSIADLVAHPSTIYYQRTIPNPTQHLWRPAIGMSPGNALYAVGWGSTSSPGHILALVATGNVTGPGTGVTFTVSDLTSGPAAVPDVGGDTGSAGPTSALWSSGHLWFVSTRPCLPPGDVFSTGCVRVTELSTSSAFAIIQDFVIATTAYSNFGGGIGLAGDGSLVVVYSQAPSGPATGGPVPISTVATIQVAGDPANTVRPSQLVDQGVVSCLGGPECRGGNGGAASYLAVPADPLDSHAVWEGAVASVAGGWRTWVSRLRTATGSPTGTFALAGGRSATNSLRLGIGLTPGTAAVATQVLVSNSPTTSSGRLASAIQAPIGWRMPWSLADPAAGGTSATGSRVVYLQWGDGRGNWSAVQSKSITVDTPLGSDLVPLNPARLLDTRFGTGLGGPFVSRVARSFQVTGRGGVPMGAVAVTGNLTVTGQTSAGYVFLGPTAPSNPTSSTLNFPLGDTRANGVTVKLSSNGRLGAVFVGSGASKKTHLIFDVTGYLLADNPNAPIGSTWVPIEPVRALDTRIPIGLSGKFASKVPRTFCITGCVPVPDDAVAVTGNLTVTGQTTAGYVFLGPVPISNPTSSTLNFPINDTRANNVTVRLDDNGNLTAVFVGASGAARTNLIFDVTGYFVRGPWGATFIPLNPTRILDTRAGLGLTGPFVQGTPRSFATAGRGGVPATGTLGVTGNLTITLQTSSGYAFLGPTAPAIPTSSTINVPFGDTRANGVDVGLAANGSLGAVWVGKPSSRAAMIFDVSGYFR